MGYLIDSRTLMYATGGLAYGATRNGFSQASNYGATVVTSSSGTHSGWTVGGGIEYALDARWSAKLEYDYLAFNDGVSSSTTVVRNPGQHAIFTVQAANSSANTVQLGLNRHF
jgi:opacity protein-like surface antigen